MKPTSTPTSMSPLIAWRPPMMRMPTVATAAMNSTIGKYAALRLTVTRLAARLVSLSAANCARWRGSCAKERTTLMPDSVSCR